MTTEPVQQSERPRWKLVSFIFLYTVAVKVLPYVLYRLGMDVEKDFAIYPWNFSPIFAVALFGGAMYQSRGNVFAVPLLAMLAGDLGIWAVTGKAEWAFYSGQFVVYAAFTVCALFGLLLRSQRSWGRVTGAGIASCVSFFLITNFATWVGSTTYPQTFAGLLDCYIMGLPFLKNSLIATVLFSGILFSPICIRQSVGKDAQLDVVLAN